MSFELFVAWRYLKAERKGLFAMVTTAIGVAGVMVGVAALITTLSVMNGFQADIQRKVIGAQSHLNVYGARSAGESLTATLACSRFSPLATPFLMAVRSPSVVSTSTRRKSTVESGFTT